MKSQKDVMQKANEIKKEKLQSVYEVRTMKEKSKV